MTELQEIIRVLTWKKVKETDIFDEKTVLENEKRYQLYRGIKDGHYRTDDEAALGVYGTDRKDQRYQKLKSRLRQQLLKSLFYFDIKSSNQTPYQEAVYNCTLNVAYAQLLIVNGARTVGSGIARETLQLAQRFDLTETAWQCLKILREYEASRGSWKDYNRYNTLLQTTQQHLLAEVRSDELMDRFELLYAKSVSDRPEELEQLKQFSDEIAAIKAGHSTFRTSLNYFRAGAYEALARKDFAAAVVYCSEAEQFLDDNPHLSSRPRRGEFASITMLCYIHTRDYQSAQQYAERCLHYFTEGSRNWVAFMSNYFLTSMHTGNFGNAAEIFLDVTERPQFSNLPPAQQEVWKLYKIVLLYLIRTGWAQLSDAVVRALQKKFNLYEFLSEMPVASRDKHGMNIALLILQVAFLLEEGNTEGVEAKVEAVRQYRTIHLRRREYMRSSTFLKLLHILMDSELNLKRTERKARPHYEKLLPESGSKQGEMEGLEVIPYDKLWEIILWRVRELQSKGVLPVITART